MVTVPPGGRERGEPSAGRVGRGDAGGQRFQLGKKCYNKKKAEHIKADRGDRGTPTGWGRQRKRICGEARDEAG